MKPTTDRICEALAEIEREHRVRVIYACESGSRAWGFESADSDYDVRFLYAHPLDWYLSVNERRDVIEIPVEDELDISGWDLRKALRLMRKSNPALLEWLHSPIVYREEADAVSRFRALATRCYSPRSCLHHYLHMAQGNFREYLRGEEVWLKKYLYVLRPVLACRWIEAGRGVVPMRTQPLIDACVAAPELHDAINTLIRKKREGAELDRGPRIPVISDFLEAELARLVALPAPSPQERLADEDFDRLFRDLIGH